MDNKERLELAVKPVGYDDKDFDKFNYFHAIGNWKMAEQLFTEQQTQLIQANARIEELKKQSEIYKELAKTHLSEWFEADKKINELISQLKPFQDAYFKGLSMETIAELAKKSIRLTKDNRELEDELEEIKSIASKEIGRDFISVTDTENYKNIVKLCTQSTIDK